MVEKKRNQNRFSFIHASHPDRFKDKELQNKIRRHVMGTVGQLRVKPPRNPTVAVDILPNMVNVAEPGQQRMLEPYQQNTMPSIPFLGIYPAETNIRARQLIHFMQVAGDLQFIPFRYESYSMATTDPAAFYLYLANAAFLHSHMTQQNNNSESGIYLGICLNQVIERLEKEAPHVSPGLMYTMLSLACHETHLGNWDRRVLHLDGLERAVKGRGGLDRLDHTLSLLIFWFDIIESSSRDSIPRYAVPKHLMIEEASHDTISPSLRSIIGRLKLSGYREIPGALQRLGVLVDFMSHKPRSDKLRESSSRAASVITPILHALLSMPRVTIDRNDGMPSDYLIELTRVALLIILARLKQVFSFPNGELLSLQERFELVLFRHSGSDLLELELWCIIYVALIDQEHMGAYVQYIGNLTKRLQIRGPEKVLETVRNIISVDRILPLDIETLFLSLDMRNQDPVLDQS